MPVRYQLDYTKEAEQELAALWLDQPPGASQSEVRWAADQLEKYLRTDAHLKGNVAPGYDGTVLRCTMYPLEVDFRVSEDDRRVFVLRFGPTLHKF
jgi:hypothetical protein